MPSLHHSVHTILDHQILGMSGHAGCISSRVGAFRLPDLWGPIGDYLGAIGASVGAIWGGFSARSSGLQSEVFFGDPQKLRAFLPTGSTHYSGLESRLRCAVLLLGIRTRTYPLRASAARELTEFITVQLACTLNMNGAVIKMPALMPDRSTHHETETGGTTSRTHARRRVVS